MKLHYYKPSKDSSNFGDELNKYLWEHYFPHLFDDDVSQVFFGIGTILQAGRKFYPTSKIIVFGSGAANDQQQMEDNFHIEFVRGPLTANALNLTEDQYITDPAIITPDLFPKSNSPKKYNFAYMPHYSVANNAYRKVVEKLGIKYIDPHEPVETIIESMNASSIIICEAMHAAIVADAYRIPWIPIRSYASFNAFKWNDWGQSLGLTFQIQQFPRLYDKGGLKESIKRTIYTWRLKKLKKAQAFLSDQTTMERAKKKVLLKISELKKTYVIE